MTTARIIGYEVDIRLTKCDETILPEWPTPGVVQYRITVWSGLGYSSRIPEGEFYDDDVLIFENNALDPLPVIASATVKDGRVEVVFRFRQALET